MIGDILEPNSDSYKFMMQSLKEGKTFKEFTELEQAMMILDNHPVYKSYLELLEDQKGVA